MYLPFAKNVANHSPIIAIRVATVQQALRFFNVSIIRHCHCTNPLSLMDVHGLSSASISSLDNMPLADSPLHTYLTLMS